MSNATTIIHEVESFPVEERILIVDSLLQTLNPPNREMDREWAHVAKSRLEELRSGRVRAVSGEMERKEALAGFDDTVYETD